MTTYNTPFLLFNSKIPLFSPNKSLQSINAFCFFYVSTFGCFFFFFNHLLFFPSANLEWLLPFVQHFNSLFWHSSLTHSMRISQTVEYHDNLLLLLNLTTINTAKSLYKYHLVCSTRLWNSLTVQHNAVQIKLNKYLLNNYVIERTNPILCPGRWNVFLKIKEWGVPLIT